MRSDKSRILYPLTIVTVAFSTLFGLTLFFSISTNLYIIALVLIYVILPPFFTAIRHAYAYFILLPVPCLGLWLMSIAFMSSFAIPVLQASILVSIIPIALTALVHLFSRSRSMVGRVSVASFSRHSISVASGIFFIVGVGMLGPTPLELDVLNKYIFYGFLVFAYVATSMLYVNSAYRYGALCRKLGTNRIERTLSSIWEKIGNRFPEQEKDVDLLRYYCEESLRMFEEGNYEMAFISGYKVINEKTVVNPRDFISDKREGEPSSFSEVRTILMHSRREKTRINVKRIREIKGKLPQYCIELLERCFTFVQTLTR